MTKHIILTDSAMSASDILLTVKDSLPQVIEGLAAGEYTVRDTSAPVAGTVVASASAPSGFAASGWSVVTGAGDKEVTLTISALPSDGGSAITALQYSVDGGVTWVLLSGTGTGARMLTLAAGGTAYDFMLRAVNALGNGAASEIKTATSGALVGTDWALADDFTTKGTGSIAGMTAATGQSWEAGNGTVESGVGLYWPSGTPVNALNGFVGEDVVVEADVARTGYSTTGVPWLLGRVSGDGATFYQVGSNQAGTELRIGRTVNGTYSIIGAAIARPAPAAGAAETWRMEIEGSAIRLYVDGVLMGERTDTNIPGSGRVGLRASAADSDATKRTVWKGIRARAL